MIYFSVIQLVASADCAGALDITDDLQHLLVCSQFYVMLLVFFCPPYGMFILYNFN